MQRNIVVKKISTFILVTLAASMFGLILGISILPKIACAQEFSLCYLLRFVKDDIVTPRTCKRDPTEPLCSVFQKGGGGDRYY